MLTLIARVRFLGWGLLSLGIVVILYVMVWFAHFSLTLRPFGATPFSWSFIQANPIWGVELLSGLCSIGIGAVVIAGTRPWANAEARRRATDEF